MLSSQVNAVTGALFTSEVMQAVADEVGGPCHLSPETQVLFPAL